MQTLHSNEQRCDTDRYERPFTIDNTDHNHSDVIWDITGSENKNEERITAGSAIYDCLGATEEHYERLQLEGERSDGHIYTEHIPRVMRDILLEMPPGMTAKDILKTCVDDQLTPYESDDEDLEEDSDYMEGETQQPNE